MTENYVKTKNMFSIKNSGNKNRKQKNIPQK